MNYFVHKLSLDSIFEEESEVITISEQDQIMAALSLFFQWPEYSSAFIVSNTQPNHNPISISFDHEHRSPAYLFLTSPIHDELLLQNNQHIHVRVIVFRKYFEFESKVLVRHIDSRYIIDIPSKLKVFRPQRLPRIILEDTQNTSLNLTLTSSHLTKVSLCKITEIGPTSFCAELPNSNLERLDRLSLGQALIPIELIRIKNNKLTFQLNFEDGSQAGTYFDIYRQYRFPNLKPRKLFRKPELLELYFKTGYIDKFDQSLNSYSKDLDLIYDEINNNQHVYSCDYVLLSPDGSLTGASSTTLAFFDSDIPLWVFHQLCAFKNPDLLESSGFLYTWRAEYLLARPEALNAIVWFDSKSRWLERIYVKFSKQIPKSVSLHAVHVTKVTAIDPQPKNTFDVRTIKLGTSQRITISHNHIIGGINPKLLNISCLLDAIISLNSEGNDLEVDELAKGLLHHANLRSVELEITCQKSENSTQTTTSVNSTDRFARFQKDSMTDFIASVEHVVAVSKRKKDLGNLE